MNIGELIPELEAHLSSVTDAFYEIALRNAAREFFRDTGCWIEEIPINIRAGKNEYDIPLPNGVAIHKVLATTVDSEEIDPMGYTDIIEKQKRSGSPIGIYRTGNKTKVAPTPCGDHKMVINAALIPSTTATEIDTPLMDNYGEYIVKGALAYLFDMPGKDWTDPAMAQVHRIPFEEAKMEGKREAAGYNDSRGTNTRITRTYRDDY